MIFTGAIAINSTGSASTLDLILHASLVGKAVLLLLLLASLFSWAIIFMKQKTLKSALSETQSFLNMFWYGQDLEEIFHKSDQYTKSPVASVFKAGFKELKKISQLESTSNKQFPILSSGIDNINRSLQRATIAEISILEKYVGVLATVGSASPFVGLFGTVWGIMDSFQGIGATGNANLAIVAPGISEALIATAFGLAAAIPAVVAYNIFVGKIKNLTSEMDTFSQDFLNIIQRSLLKSHQPNSPSQQV